jgi:hypothetical protein
MNEARPGIGNAGHGKAGHGNSGNPTISQGGNANPSTTQIPRSVPHSPGVAAAPPRVVPAPVDDSLSLIGDDRTTNEPVKSKIHGITGTTGLSASLGHQEYKRPSHVNKTGACRVRTFHCRLTEQSVEYMDQTINSWLDQHPEIEIKFSTSVVGLWDGKLKEPTLVINVWY